MQVQVNQEFSEYFQDLQQVFIYIIDACNLGCRQCLYKPWLRRGREIKLEVALALLQEFRKMGASKLSILGGEPTAYVLLPTLIRKAKDLGYKYVRIDTNGQFDSELLAQRGMRELDELTFSLDGDTPEINDAVRGHGSFGKCVENIQEAVRWGYNVDITCCVHRGNVGKNSQGIYLLERMIDFVASIGVRRLNLHPLFRMGVPRDHWAGETDISVQDWLELYPYLRQSIEAGKYHISVRVPKRFVTKKEFEEDLAYYGYCPVKMGERVLVHSNGQIQICALMIGTPNSVARFHVEGDQVIIEWEKGANEMDCNQFDLTNPTPCTNQRRDFGELVPLCISFKPQQEEFIWKKLNGKWTLRFKKE